MESFLNERRVQQGEDWNLDILLSQSQTEYIPFIVGKRENPHWVITVASTKFEKNNRYVESWWLALGSATPMFKQTTPQYIGELTKAPESKNDIPNSASDEPFEYLYQYKIVNDPEGIKYHYVYFDNNNTLHYDYECRIRFNLTTFNSATGKRDIGTSNWGSQNYLYQITLVSGQEMVDTIMEAKQGHPDLDWREDWPVQGADESDIDYRNRMIEWLGTTQKDVFTFIKQRIPDYFQRDIDWNSPLGQIWVPQPILTPTKLQVDNNLRQII